MRHSLANQGGFTLAEVLVTTALMGLVMGGVFVLQRGGQQAYLLGSSRVEAQQNARIALELMTRELRSATSIVSSDTNIPNISFKDQCGNPVEYALDGAWLNRSGPDYSDRSNCVFASTSTSSHVIGGVQTFALTFYSVYDVSSGTYTTTTTAAQIRVIKIELATRTEQSVEGSPGDQRATVKSTVQLRNLS